MELSHKDCNITSSSADFLWADELVNFPLCVTGLYVPVLCQYSWDNLGLRLCAPVA